MPAVLDVPAAPPAAVPEPGPAAAVCADPPDLHLPGVGPGGAGLVVPGAALSSYAAFRAWKLSDDCPGWGKFEWIGNHPRLDVMPESLLTHGFPKADLCRVLANTVAADRRGLYFTDSTTVAAPADAGATGTGPRVLCEPDFVFLSHQTIASGRVTLTPKRNREGDFTEIVGPPDLVLEVLSDSSVRKDTIELPADLFALGVTEYWLADARADPPTLTVHTRGDTGFVPRPAGPDGFSRSELLGAAYRLTAQTGESGLREVWAEARDA